MVEVSDDAKFRSLPNRSFAVFKKEDGILPQIATRLLNLRGDYKKLEAQAKAQGDKVAEKKYE